MSVLDAVMRIRELEQQNSQNMVDTMLKGFALAQDAQKTSMLMDIEKQKLSNDISTKMLTAKAAVAQHGLSIDENGNLAPLGESLIDSIRKANEKPESELDIAIKENRLDAAKEKNEETQQKLRVGELAESLPKLSPDASKEDIEAFYASMPSDVAETVRGLAEYKIDPSKFASLRTDLRTSYLALASKATAGGFDMMEYPKRYKYISGIQDPSTFAGRNITSLNTVAHHLAQLDEEIEANKGVNFKPMQTLRNWVEEITGDPNITDEKVVMKVVKDELEKALSGTVTQEALRDFDRIFNPNVGYDAKKNAVKTFVKIVKGRIQPYRQGFKQVMKRDENGEIINEESRYLFDKYLGSESTTSEAAPKTAEDGTFKVKDTDSILQRLNKKYPYLNLGQ